MITNRSLLLAEDGARWMEPREQFQHFPSSLDLHPMMARPVWLVLSIVMREIGCKFRNSMTVDGQMRNIRAATTGKATRRLLTNDY